jgi:hypothetical protein
VVVSTGAADPAGVVVPAGTGVSAGGVTSAAVGVPLDDAVDDAAGASSFDFCFGVTTTSTAGESLEFFSGTTAGCAECSSCSFIATPEYFPLLVLFNCNAV